MQNNALGREDGIFCEVILPEVSPALALAIQGLPDSLKAPIQSGYLLFQILDCLEALHSTEAEQRRLLDCFDQTLLRDQDPVERLEALAASASVGRTEAEQALCRSAGAVLRCFRALPHQQRSIIQERLLERSRGLRQLAPALRHSAPGVRCFGDLDRYCRAGAGTMGRCLTDLFIDALDQREQADAALLEERRVLGASLGVGLRLVDIVQNVARDAGRGWCFLPREEAAVAGVSVEALVARLRTSGAELELTGPERALLCWLGEQAGEHLRAGARYTHLWPEEAGADIRRFCTALLEPARSALREAAPAPALPPASEAGVLALLRSVRHLQSLQNPDGHYLAELEANVSLTAEYVFLMHMLQRRDRERERKAAADLIARQGEDGGWPLYAGGPGDLSISVEAYVAMKLSGEPEDAPHMSRACAFIRSQGGVQSVRVFTKIHLALLGLGPWSDAPALPPWLMLLPDKAPVSIYQMSSWARSCVVPLLILLDARPVFPPETPISIEELRQTGPVNAPRRSVSDRFFFLVDRVLKSADRRGIRPARARSLRRAEAWILRHQDDEGDFGGIIPAMAYSLLALRVRGYSGQHLIIQKGWEAIERHLIERGDRLTLQSCIGPVWDTALAVVALTQAGLPPDSAHLARSAHWLLGKECCHYGDWSIKNPTGRPGGWAFEYNNRYYPDSDDTALVSLALHDLKLGALSGQRDAALRRAADWVRSMQNQDGGWGAFDIDNTQTLWNRVPFADHGAMLDPSSPDLTGHVLEMFGALGRTAADPVVARAIAYIRQEQRPDGSWYGRWGVNYLYGTGCVLPGLIAVGIPQDDPMVVRGVAFLLGTQRPDGGWGEHCRSYDLGRFVPHPSTASQTAWALLGLVAAGCGDTEAAHRGARWLIRQQEPAGSWQETAFTGTGFPEHFYIRYHQYRDCFPTIALARYQQTLRGAGS